MNKCDLEEAKAIAIQRFKELAIDLSRWKYEHEQHYSSGGGWVVLNAKASLEHPSFCVSFDYEAKTITMRLALETILIEPMHKNGAGMLNKFHRAILKRNDEETATARCQSIIKALQPPEQAKVPGTIDGELEPPKRVKKGFWGFS